MNALGYIRVSTEHQATDGESIGGQMTTILGHAKTLGARLKTTYIDPAVSSGLPPWERHGGTFQVDKLRLVPELALPSDTVAECRTEGAWEMFECAEPGDVIIMQEMDRLWRSPYDCLRSIEEHLKPKGVLLSIVNFLGGKIIDYDDNSFDIAFLTMGQIMAKQERVTITRRIRDRFDRDRENHQWVGAFCPAGMMDIGKRDSSGKVMLVPDPETRAIMREIVYLKDAGHGDHGMNWHEIGMIMYHKKYRRRPKKGKGFGPHVWGDPLVRLQKRTKGRGYTIKDTKTLKRYYRDEKIFQRREAEESAAVMREAADLGLDLALDTRPHSGGD